MRVYVSVYACACVCMSMRVCVSVSVSVCACLCKCVCVCMYVCACVFVRVCECVCMYVHLFVLDRRNVLIDKNLFIFLSHLILCSFSLSMSPFLSFFPLLISSNPIEALMPLSY